MPRSPSHGVRIGLLRREAGESSVRYELGLAFPSETLVGTAIVALADGSVRFEGLPDATPAWACVQASSLLRAAWVARGKRPAGTMPRRIERWRPTRD